MYESPHGSLATWKANKKLWWRPNLLRPKLQALVSPGKPEDIWSFGKLLTVYINITKLCLPIFLIQTITTSCFINANYKNT